MKKYTYYFPAFLALLLCLWGCEKRREPLPEPTAPAAIPAPPATVKIPFQDAIIPASYELPSGALATWRDFAEHKPTLVLFSSHPMLEPFSGEKQELTRLIRSGDSAEIINRGQLWSADPLFLSPQAVSVAIESGLISELIIVRPSNKPPDEISLADFREQTTGAGFLTQSEAQALTLTDSGIIGGKVRGISLRIVHPERLPKLAKPVILHFDLGYFKDLYINEVKTPSYDLIHQLASQVKEAAFPTIATTLSYSNQEIDLSLESRFMIRDLADILRNPKLLEGGTPASWSIRASALYAGTMFSESKARELIQQAVVATPEDAAAHYALAIDLFEQQRNDQGFLALDHAARLDRGYALEYIYLAERGFEIGQNRKSIDLLSKAAGALPNTPILRLQLAKQLIQVGRGTEAIPIITELQGFKWSETIHPGAQSLLKEMQQLATANTMPRLPDTPSAAAGEKTAERMPATFNHMMMGVPKK